MNWRIPLTALALSAGFFFTGYPAISEPKSSIFVSNKKPLIFYEKIILFSINNLVKNGLIFFEINESFGKKIVSLLKDSHFKDIELKKDINGKDRMIKAVLK